jgi:glycosyltransferase involved in cell wall biosynthesis
MATARISYSLTQRPSQSRIAAAYQDILRERYELISAQDDAEIVIVHHPPRNYETVYALHPALARKYVISCCVTHAEGMLASWRRNLARVQEVWTCSRWCRDLLARDHPKVTLIPYVAERDFSCSAAALDSLERLIGFAGDHVYFLAIAAPREPRKNVHMLVESFKRVARAIPRARLIVKSTHHDTPSWAPHEQVVFLPFQMPFEYISGLYRLAHVYVSAHHAEAWGLTMSDAMLCGKPVIATGYSGNLDFMNDGNSFLLPYTEGEVEIDEPATGLERGMKWAEPDPAALEESFVRLYATHADPDTRERAERGRREVSRFSRQRAAELVLGRIEAALAGGGARQPPAMAAEPLAAAGAAAPLAATAVV